MSLFDVGFQLSYLAVLAIVVLQPMFYGLWRPKIKLLDLRQLNTLLQDV